MMASDFNDRHDEYLSTISQILARDSTAGTSTNVAFHSAISNYSNWNYVREMLIDIRNHANLTGGMACMVWHRDGSLEGIVEHRRWLDHKVRTLETDNYKPVRRCIHQPVWSKNRWKSLT